MVMDNASYSTLVENYPKSIWRKGDIQKWLTENNIEFYSLETFQNFIKKIKALIPRVK